jgi:glycosyltransferase involved in cell wall biosynthesis
MEEMNPKFSIIIVAYKRYNELKCLLYSLLSQSFQDFEIIIIHDGFDKYHKLLFNNFENDNRIKYIQTNIRYNDWGMSLRNIGLDIANGDWIINTNDDNYYTPNWLKEINNNIHDSINFIYYDAVLSHNNLLNHNKKDYGLLIPQIKHSHIDMGQFVVKSDIIKKYKFESIAPADGVLIEEMKHELKPEYINKILFVHN